MNFTTYQWNYIYKIIILKCFPHIMKEKLVVAKKLKYIKIENKKLKIFKIKKLKILRHISEIIVTR